MNTPEENAFIEAWKAFVKESVEIVIIKVSKADDAENVPPRFQTLYEFILRARTDALKVASELGAGLVKVAGDANPNILEQMQRELEFATVLSRRARSAKALDQSLRRGRTVIESLKGILEKAYGEKMPLAPWLALELLGEGLDLAKTLALRVNRKKST